MPTRAARALPRPVGARAAATCASPPPTASRRCWRSPPRCDAVVVIGSANSSNTRALEQLAREAGCAAGAPGQRRRRAPRRPHRHRRRHRRRVGPRGAGRRACIARLAPAEGVEEVRITDEDEYFPPPRELRELLDRRRRGRHLRPRRLGARPPRRRRPRPRRQRRAGGASPDATRQPGVHDRHRDQLHRSMDESTAEQWARHRRRDGEEPAPGGRPSPRHARARSSDITDGFATDQLTHCLPDRHAGRAGRRRRRGRRRLPLPRHRQGRSSVPNHPEIAAAILKPYVRPEVHDDDPGPPGLPGPALLPPLRRRPERPREVPRRAHREEFELAEQFADDWDQTASTPTTTPTRSSTSSRWSARSSRRPRSSRSSRRRSRYDRRSNVAAVRGAGLRLGLVEQLLELVVRALGELAHRAARHAAAFAAVGRRDRRRRRPARASRA